MLVDRAQFLIFAGVIAASSLACERDRYRPAPESATPVPPPTPSAALSAALQPGPVVVDVIDAASGPGAPTCDDNQGSPEECPSVGPSDEGMCANVILKRCSEFKAAMKPRVATDAVACLRALKGSERCDPARVNQCGHAALMTACPEPARSKRGQLTAATATQPVSVALVADAPADASALATACASIQRACGDRRLAPTQADCRQTLSGLNDLGRANMVDCVSKRCVDGGLYACEAVPKPVTL